MCGRTGLTLNKEKLRCACSYKQNGRYIKPEWLPEHNDGREYIGSHNIAPTDVTPVLVSGRQFKNSTESSRVLKPMMWGIIPPWHKGDYRSHNLSTNNCRIENIKSSKLYNPILQNGGRCIVVVEGFYEWQTTDKSSKIKQPYYIYSPQNDGVMTDNVETWKYTFSDDHGWEGIKLLHMAGLYNVWQNDGTIIYSYSVITMDSNSTLDWLHHRMPAILDNEEQIETWLNIDDVSPDMALGYLKPVKLLSWHPVSTAVNNSRNKSEECKKRITINKTKSSQRTLTTWLMKAEKRKSNINESEPKKIKHENDGRHN